MENINLFEHLRQMRIDAGLDLQAMASQSKIHLRYLEALEAGRLEDIPPVYDRLFFKTYLSFIKPENEQFYIDEFEALRKQRKTLHTSTIQRRVKFEQESRKARYLNILYIALPALVVLSLIAFMVSKSMFIKPPQDGNVKEISVRQILDTLERRQEIAADILKKTDSVSVSVNALERTWLRVVTDKADTNEYLLAKNEKLHLTADSTLGFLVGNAAGLDFTVNGKPAGVLGKPDEIIAFLKVTPKGIVSKRLKKIKRRNRP